MWSETETQVPESSIPIYARESVEIRVPNLPC